MAELRSRFLYEFRLGSPVEYLSDVIDTSGMEWLKMASEGKIVYMSASTAKPMADGPFKVGDVVPIASLFVTGRDLGRLNQYKITSLEKFEERKFLDIPEWKESEQKLSGDEMSAIFERAAYYLKHPDEYWEMMKNVKIIPDYIGYVKPTGKIDLESVISLDEIFEEARKKQKLEDGLDNLV